MNQVVNREQPRVKYVFALSRHGNGRHADFYQTVLEKTRPDVLCHESFDLTGEEAKELEERDDAIARSPELKLDTISRLEKGRAFGVPFPEHAAKVMAFAYRSGKPIYYVERYSGALRKRLDELDELEAFHKNDASKGMVSGNFARAIDSLEHHMDAFAETNRVRDERIVENLVPQAVLKNVLARHPHLKDNERLTLLVSLGTLHAGVAKKLADDGLEVEVRQPHSPVDAVDAQTEAILRKTARKPVRRELVVQALCEEMLRNGLQKTLKPISDGFDQDLLYYRIVAEKFKEPEVKSLVEEIGKNPLVTTANRVILARLKQKKIVLPKNKRELEAALRKRWPSIRFHA